MWSNAAANQPTEETACSVSGVSSKPLRLQTKAAFSSIEHCLCGLDLVIGARGCGFNVDDNRVLNVDKIIEPIAELHTLVGFRRPGRRRIGALSLICCAIAALCVGGLLSALAKNLGPKATINDVGL